MSSISRPLDQQTKGKKEETQINGIRNKQENITADIKEFRIQRHLNLLHGTWVQFLASTSITPLPVDLLPSSDFHVSPAYMWYTCAHIGKTVICIK